jgi:hypothetical protein
MKGQLKIDNPDTDDIGHTRQTKHKNTTQPRKLKR